MITATPLQKEIIESRAPITIVAAGVGAGSTYSLYLKALASNQSSTIIVGSYRKADQCFLEFRDYFRDYINKVCFSEKIIHLNSMISVCFQSQDTQLNFRPLILVDDVHTLNKQFVKRLLSLPQHTLVFTSKPYECGYRTPLYENGMLQKDDDGVIIYTGHSWDTSLVNWGKQCELGFVGNKALPKDYKSHVKVITGYGVEDNKMLGFVSGGLSEALSKLPQREQNRLSGTWVK